MGFGGNGNSSGAITFGHGSCVIDGPFAGLTALFYSTGENVPCLSRGLRSGEDFRRLCSDKIRPDIIETLLRSQDYESFNLGLEHGAHRVIPNCVQGDWLSFTSPYGIYYHRAMFIVETYCVPVVLGPLRLIKPLDPVFFLHHTQIDRLWWTWQHQDSGKRIVEYIGKAHNDSDQGASLVDVLDMSNLAPQTMISEVMNTEFDLLCYRY